MALSSFTRAYPPTAPPPGPAVVLPVADGKVLVAGTEPGARLLTEADDVALASPLYLGTQAETPCVAGTLNGTEPDGTRWATLRELYGNLTEDEYALAGYAAQMVYWNATSGFCPVCGHETTQKDHDWGKVCTNCGHTGYPRVSPAVLIVVHDGNRILLSHKEGWGPRYSILAGFVEPGESLEECCAREAMEETGVIVTDIKYAGSQPWPFPHQLMIGFTARYAGGDIVRDEAELDDARWFDVTAMPDLPGKSSLSRKLIDEWVISRSSVN